MSSHHLSRPTAEEVIRYRHQLGVNLGGIFVLEQWLHPGMFNAGASGSTELDAVVASLTIRGLVETRIKWETHWRTALTDGDLQWLTSTAGCNHIRLPIGYFTLGPDFCHNTPFAMQIAEVYANGWKAVKDICSRSYRYGIGVLIVLQVMPGRQGSAHSTTDAGANVKDAWERNFNIDLTMRCLKFIVREISTDAALSGVLGIQICNQTFSDTSATYEWYGDVLRELSTIHSSLPVYISDTWDLRKALKWSFEQNTLADSQHRCPVIVGTCRFYAFEERHKKMSPDEIVELVVEELREIDSNTSGSVSNLEGAACVYVGEYSCALATESWKRVSVDRWSDLSQKIGLAQSTKWQGKASGSAFWTLKSEWQDDTSWNFREQVENGAINTPKHSIYTSNQVQEKLAAADQKRSHLMASAMDSHVKHFQKIGGKYEHWRYADGWHLGFTDARTFFASRFDNILPTSVASKGAPHAIIGADTIGALDLWVLKRMREEDRVNRGKPKDKDKNNSMWEWELGFRAGVKGFYDLVGIKVGVDSTKT